MNDKNLIFKLLSTNLRDGLCIEVEHIFQYSLPILIRSSSAISHWDQITLTIFKRLPH